jgi:hypothetical protein
VREKREEVGEAIEVAESSDVRGVALDQGADVVAMPLPHASLGVSRNGFGVAALEHSTDEVVRIGWY